MCRINPQIDIAFKKIFGSEENGDLLLSLINSVLPADEQIHNIVLKNPYNLANYLNDKMSILDIKATDENGKCYDIEMQIGEQGYFGQRALYYWGKSYTNQLEKSGLYSTLKKCIIISILNFKYFDDPDRYHRVLQIKDRESNVVEESVDFLELHFIELPKFSKDISTLKTSLDKWITFLTQADAFEKDSIPAELSTMPEIKRAIEVLDTIYLNNKERQIYDAEQKQLLDENGKITTALLKGRLEGEMKGRIEGKLEGKLETAKKLLQLNMPIETIMQATGLSQEDINNV